MPLVLFRSLVVLLTLLIASYLSQSTDHFKSTVDGLQQLVLLKLSSNSYIDLNLVEAYRKNKLRSQQHQQQQDPQYLKQSWVFPQLPSSYGRENATLVMLARNSDLDGALKSMRSLQDRFNSQYNYPWVFLNEVPFTSEFIEKTTLMADGAPTYYELVPESDWEPPEFIDESRLQANLFQAEQDNVLYGGFRSYRNMCHFNSGYFYRQPILLNYDWYFRVEPDVEYMCDFQYDPFRVLRENHKQYGFVITIHEYENTIPTLWNHVELFIETYPQYIHPNNAWDFLTSKEPLADISLEINSSSSYNLCHFWSNFEIGNLNFFRSEAYQKFFEHLDHAGGFYYERWGDAPVHSIAVALLLDKNEIHHFEDIGYYHAPYMTCPLAEDLLLSKRCICRLEGLEGQSTFKGMDVELHSCLPRWWKHGPGKTFMDPVV